MSVIQPITDGLAATIANAALTPSLPVYSYLPAMDGLDQVPCAAIELPDISLTPPDQADLAPLGHVEWVLTYPVHLYFEMDDMSYQQPLAAQTVEAVIAAITADTSLAGTAYDASVVNSKIAYDEQAARPLFRYELEVQVLKFVVTQ